MKKLFILASILLVVFLPACKKETKIPVSEIEEFAGARPPASTPSILQWQKCLGSSANDYGFAVAKAIDGTGYFVAGATEGNNGNVSGNHGGRDLWVIKIDLSGANILWQKTLGGAGSDEATSVVATADGGCLVAGRTTSTDGDVVGNKGGNDIWLVKLSASGIVDLQQTKTLGGSGYDISRQIIKTIDGGYAIVGQTTSNDGDLAGSGTTKGRAWVIKLDAAATVIWQKTLDLPASKDDSGSGITETSTGAFAITGRTLDLNTNADIWVASFDQHNNYWIKSFGGTTSDVGFGIVTSEANGQDNGFVATGNIGSDASATKLNINGGVDWQKTFKPSGSLVRGRSIVSTATGYVIVGDNNGDMMIWKLGKDGTFLNGTTLGGAKDDKAENVITTDDGMFLSVGSSNSSNGIVSGNHGLSDVWVVKFQF
jgi:hypothetical protein